MNEQVSALILKQTDYRDSDVILSVLTREYGKLSFLAAGVRKITSKNAGAVIPCTCSMIQFDYKPHRSVQRLKTARTVQMFPVIHSDLVLSAAATAATETADALSMPENELGTSQEEYRYLETALQGLEEGRKPDLLLALYLADWMRLFGIEPDVDECVRCGSLSVSAISVADGGFLCPQCASLAGVEQSDVRELRQFRHIVKGGLQHIHDLETLVDHAGKDLKLLRAMTERHAGVHLRAFDFFYHVFGIE